MVGTTHRGAVTTPARGQDSAPASAQQRVGPDTNGVVRPAASCFQQKVLARVSDAVTTIA